MLPNRPDNQKTTLHAAPKMCDWAKDSVFAYLDGELTPQQKAEFEAHLGVCVACRQEAALCRTSDLALGAAKSAIPPPGDLRPGFYARLAAERQKPPRPLWFGWRAAVPALALTLIATALLRPKPTHLEPTPPSATKSGDIASIRPIRVTPPTQPDSMNTPVVPGVKDKNASTSNTLAAKINLESLRDTVRLHKLQHFAKNDRDKSYRRSSLANAKRPKASSLFAFVQRDTMSLAYIDGVASKQYKEEKALSLLQSKSDNLYDARSLGMALKSSSKSDSVTHYREKALSTTLAESVEPRSEARLVTASVHTEVNLHVSDEIRGFMSSTRISNATMKHEGQPVLAIDSEEESPMPAELPSLP